MFPISGLGTPEHAGIAGFTPDADSASVSVFGLINDVENHVHLFLDAALQKAKKISFHPNENTATVVISIESFIKFLEWSGNSHEFIQLYESD